ncbi:MAG TPA: acyl-CoA dehydrogenase family protein [Rhodocyclaceae bacterium]|nr:acyl-CoA dehydrogenase family protein [Rhodocyclaceae bacterium]
MTYTHLLNDLDLLPESRSLDPDAAPQAGGDSTQTVQIVRASVLAQVPEVTTQLMRSFASTAALRDAQGGTPKAQRDELRVSGLLALSIPQALGGLGASWSEVLRVVRQLSRVDSSVAHLFAFHHLMLATVQLFGHHAQWQPWLALSARHDWFWGNALNPLDQRATWRAIDGGVEISGRKSFCSGAADSEMLIVSAYPEGAAGAFLVAAVPTGRSGIQIFNDWNNIGQRQTDSGSVHFERLRVDDGERLCDPGPLSTPRACLRPLIAQAILVNIYVGIAEGAFEDARQYTVNEARPWPPSGQSRVVEDPHVRVSFGEFQVGLAAMRALADQAGAALDAALARGDALTEAERGELAITIATAKVAATRTGLDICNRLFEVTGARSTHASLGLDRHWRNLRTHTLHDPLASKLEQLGEWVLEGRYPVPSFYS